MDIKLDTKHLCQLGCQNIYIYSLKKSYKNNNHNNHKFLRIVAVVGGGIITATLSQAVKTIIFTTFDKMSSPVDNPWRCDCALHWLRSWIDEEGQRLLSSAERRLVCTEPPRLSRLSLVEVPLNSLVCIPPLVQLEPRRLAVHLGESLRVSCHASGYPRPQVRKSSQKAVVGCHRYCF